jgi:hypothetical protein
MDVISIMPDITERIEGFTGCKMAVGFERAEIRLGLLKAGNLTA